MLPFNFLNPVRIVYGIGQVSQVAKMIPSGVRLLLVYGQKSIKANGLFSKLETYLKPHTFTEASGIQPNPCLEDLLPIVEKIKRERVSFILAVGGGSVIDAAKFLTVAPFIGDPWEHMKKNKPYPDRIPFGTILTLPATGSEGNGSFVITRKETREKLVFLDPPVHPNFTILDPTCVTSLPKKEIGNGLVDAFSHVIEQYLTYPVNAPIQDGLSETILRTLIGLGPVLLADPTDLENIGNFMLCTTLALNGLIGMGVPQDWAAHMIAHELTVEFGLAHAQTLAIIFPVLLAMQKEEKRDKLLQYARNVWQISGQHSEDEQIHRAINKTRGFFEDAGVGTKLSSYGIHSDCSDMIAKKMARQGLFPLGEKGKVTEETVRTILKMCQ